MKAIGYQPSVGLNVGSTPARQASGDTNVYGNGSGYTALGRGLGIVQATIEKEREEDMVADVTAAKNEYDKRVSELLYNEENGLMNRKLGNARGIGEEYEKEEMKIRQEVMSEMLPKYEKAHIAFANLADKDNTRNFSNVRNYSLEQKKAYRDVNFTNAINFQMENAQHYYKDPTAVQEVLDNIELMNRSNYVTEMGEEWCRSKYDEYEAKLVSATIETAIANGDNDAARNLLSVFGDKVPPAVLNKYRKGLLESDKDDAMLTAAEQAAQKAGYDITQVDAILDDYTTIEVAEGGTYYKMEEAYDDMKGTPYLWGGTSKNGIDCSAFTQKAAAAGGVNIPRTADAQLHWAEENGLFAPNDGKYTPQAGDLVFITGTDAKFKPTNSWKESQDPNKNLAYKGVTHVAFVSKNGTLYQAGSSKGVSEVPMSAFQGKIMGYGKIGTIKKSIPMSATEKDAFRNKVLAICRQKESIENERIQNRINSAEDALWELAEAGVTDPRQYEAVQKRYSNDPEVYRQVKKLVAGYVRSISSGSGGTGGTAGGLSKDDMAVFKDNIDTGAYEDENDLREAIDFLGASPAESRDLLQYYRKAQKDAFDWASLKKDFQREFGKNEGYWLGAKAAAEDFIQDYVSKNGRKPSYGQIYEALANAAAKPKSSWWTSDSSLADYERMGISNATMRAMGISNARENGDGTVSVIYPNGTVEKMDKGEFEKRAKRYS